jgi:menaquinol-cytochrome c reductase iron-sulfur subunit
VTPDPDSQSTPAKSSRRWFLSSLTAGAGIVGGIAVAIPAIGFLLAPLLKKAPRTWQAVGKVSDFEIDRIVEVTIEDTSAVPWTGETATTGAWLRRKTDSEFIVFSLNCTHLGCPVRWEADAQLFMCPCHGGVYYISGAVAAGPPPKPLQRYPVRVRNGRVEVQSSPIPIT